MMAKIVKDGRPVAAHEQQQQTRIFGRFEQPQQLQQQQTWLRTSRTDRVKERAERLRSRVKSRIERHSNHRDMSNLEMNRRLVDRANLEAIDDSSIGAGYFTVEQKAKMNVFDDAQLWSQRCASVELGYEKRNTGNIPDCDCRTLGNTKIVMSKRMTTSTMKRCGRVETSATAQRVRSWWKIVEVVQIIHQKIFFK